MVRARFWFYVLMFAAVATGSAQAGVAHPPYVPPLPPRPAPATEEIVSLTSSDGVQLPAILTWPSDKMLPAGPVILHLPDGPGHGPLRADDTARYVAQGLAQLNYPILALETRHDTQYPFGHFDDAFADVKAAIDMLSGRGFSGVVLAGDGLGALLAARYAAQSGDNRVIGLILYAPVPDLAAAWKRKVGDETYATTVARATNAVRENRQGVFIDLGNGLIFTPATFLNWYGPEAKTAMIASLTAIDKPILIAGGRDDATEPPGYLQQLADVVPSKQVTLRTYRTAHEFAGQRPRLIADTARWLGEQDIRPLLQVVTLTVDTTARDGTPLAGVLYTPATDHSQARPAFMVVHGWTGDVLRSTSHWLALRLARRGYTVLAARTRASGFRGTVSARLDDIPQDLAAWSNFLGERGFKHIIGVGHATGGLWLSIYLAQSHDTRFRGVAYLGPTRDLPDYARRAMGEDAYARAVDDAEDAVKRGEAKTDLIDVPFPQATYDEDPREPMFLSPAAPGYTYYYADAFLSYWGPHSLAVHSARIAQVKVPILAIGGSRDPQMQGAWLLQFVKHAGGPATSIFYGGPNGAPPSFEGYEHRVTDDIVSWAEKLR